MQHINNNNNNNNNNNDSNILTGPEHAGVNVKVTVNLKWYAILCRPKMYPHTNFGIPTSYNLGDLLRT